MHSTSPSGIAPGEPHSERPHGQGSASSKDTGFKAAMQSAGDRKRDAQGPIPEPVSVAANPAPVPAGATDTSAESLGRRTLSTAFVRVGPDGHLSVELRDGRVLVLRDVVMRAGDYCGVHASADVHGTRYCGEYASVAAAWPGGAPPPHAPDLAVPNPAGPKRRSVEHP